MLNWMKRRGPTTILSVSSTWSRDQSCQVSICCSTVTCRTDMPIRLSSHSGRLNPCSVVRCQTKHVSTSSGGRTRRRRPLEAITQIPGYWRAGSPRPISGPRPSRLSAPPEASDDNVGVLFCLPTEAHRGSFQRRHRLSRSRSDRFRAVISHRLSGFEISARAVCCSSQTRLERVARVADARRLDSPVI